MSYRIEFHLAALAQLHGLPETAFDALVESMVRVGDSPWDAMALRSREPEFRQVTFGRYGLVSFYVDDAAEVVRVFDVTWTG